MGAAAAASVALLALAAVGLPWALARIPEDYFLTTAAERHRRRSRHPTGRTLIAVARNALGLLLVLAGVAMLVLPGQGILTLLAGLMLMDIPGKRRVELALLRRPSVGRAVDWLRARAGRGPLRLPPKEKAGPPPHEDPDG